MTRQRIAIKGLDKDQTAPITPEVRTFEHKETVQFTDGWTALHFRTPMDRLSFGAGANSDFTHTSTHMSEQAIVRTKSGNTYFVGNGGVLNTRTGRAYAHPPVVDITIGEPSVIEGVGSMSPVEDVTILYKFVGEKGSLSPGAIAVNEKSPFADLAQKMDAALESMSNVGAVAVSRP